MMQMPSFEGWLKRQGCSYGMSLFEFFEEIFLMPCLSFGYESSYAKRKKSLYGRYCDEMKSLRESCGGFL